MPYEKGGRADKKGNKYEINCIVYELLKVLDGSNYSVVIEALGEDEKGTDILVTNHEGKKEHQQCKARNGSSDNWTISDLKARKIFNAWKIQLDRECDRKVALVSPMTCSFLVDLNDRANNTSGKADEFYDFQMRSRAMSYLKNSYVTTPIGADIFKVSGGGQNYVHGGSSLQEMLIPVIELTTNAKYVAYDYVDVVLTTVNRKVTNLITYFDFIQTEKVTDTMKATLRMIDDKLQRKVGDVDYNAIKRNAYDYVEEDIKIDSEQLKIFSTYLHKKILPTPSLTKYVSNRYRTEDEKATRISLIIAIVSIVISICASLFSVYATEDSFSFA